ncbi:centromere protein R-like isoform X2 [Pristis pectinata]|uniref:centromere protein R-like isoform X2 n=1 Tax=Pristis pectinata TaxID=685728 RepID=UPI00223E7CFD|nr:centromere protein R-like isoform X2 [Pristis pectinata]
MWIETRFPKVSSVSLTNSEHFPPGPTKVQHVAANVRMEPRRPVKRSLQLENREVEITPRKKKLEISEEKFSPVTGTQCLSPFTPKDSHFRANSDAPESHAEKTMVSTRGQLNSDQKELNILRSKVEKSVLVIQSIREKLRALKALESSKEFGYFIGAWNKGDLATELRRNRELSNLP